MSLKFLHTTAQIIQYLFMNLGIGTDAELSPQQSWPIYASGEPDTPDEVLTIYNTSNQQDGRSQIDGEMYQHYGFQVRVRSTSPTQAAIKALDIANQMAEVVNTNVVSIDSANYVVEAISQKTGVLDGGKEIPTSDRNFCTINAIASIRRVN